MEKKTFVSEEEPTLLDWSLHSGEKRSCHGHLPVWSLLQRQMKELGTLCSWTKLCKGVTFGEQQPKGTPGKGLGSLGSHTQPLVPFPPVHWLLSTQGLGLEGVCGKAAPYRLPGNAARVTWQGESRLLLLPPPSHWTCVNLPALKTGNRTGGNPQRAQGVTAGPSRTGTAIHSYLKKERFFKFVAPP